MAAVAVVIAGVAAMVVAGRDGDAPPPPPTATTWEPMANAPDGGRVLAGAVWTGGEMFVVGGWPDGTWVAYDPAFDRWRVLPRGAGGAATPAGTSPLVVRTGPVGGRPGGLLLVWGGRDGVGNAGGSVGPDAGGLLTSGVWWDPWARTDVTGIEADLLPGGGDFVGRAVWAEDRLIAMARHRRQGWWRAAALTGYWDWEDVDAPRDGADGPLVWTGEELLMLGWHPYAYSLRTNRWVGREVRPQHSGPHDRALWADGEAVVWGQGDNGWWWVAYDPADDSWRELPDPPRRVVDGATQVDTIWTGEWLVVIGGRAGEPIAAGLLDPNTGRWHLLDDGPVNARHGHVAVWTGTEIIIWGGTTATALDNAAAATSDGVRLRFGDLHDLAAPDPDDRPRWWRRDLDGRSTLLATDQIAAVSGFADDGSRVLIAVSLADGTEIWQQPHASDRPPLLAEDLLIATPGPPERVVALRLEDGQQAWESSLPDDFQPASVGHQGDLLIVTAASTSPSHEAPPGLVLGIEAATGQVRWTSELPARTQPECSRPAVTGSLAFVQTRMVGGTTAVLALNARTGEHQWTEATVSRYQPCDVVSMHVTADHVHVALQPSGTVALGLTDGQAAWSSHSRSPVGTVGTDLILQHPQQLFRVDPATGDTLVPLVQAHHPPARASAHWLGTLADGRMVVLNDTEIVIFDPMTGDEVRRIPAPSPAWSLAVAGDTLLIGTSTDGVLVLPLTGHQPAG